MFKEAKELKRKYLANPYQYESLYERLRRDNSVDLRDNSIIIDLGNGYDEIKAIDENKRF